MPIFLADIDHPSVPDIQSTFEPPISIKKSTNKVSIIHVDDIEELVAILNICEIIRAFISVRFKFYTNPTSFK